MVEETGLMTSELLLDSNVNVDLVQYNVNACLLTYFKTTKHRNFPGLLFEF